MDLCGDYRDLYVQRVQHLDKVKRKLQQFASLDNLTLTDAQNPPHPTFYQLQTAMVGLMEQDVTLMRQLITLQESVEQLKSFRQSQLSPAGSTQSLSEDLDSLSVAGDLPLSAASGHRQYFSRQNSILRIPIPPRRESGVKLRTILDDPDETSSGVSSRSGSDGTFKPTRIKSSGRPKSLVISTDSDCHSRQSSSGDSPNSPDSHPRLKNSFDSGIHLSADVVYV